MSGHDRTKFYNILDELCTFDPYKPYDCSD